jgi:hypothetical protein
MFHTKGPIIRVLKLFQTVVVIARGDILRSMALMLGVSRLLTGGFRPIVVGEVFF